MPPTPVPTPPVPHLTPGQPGPGWDEPMNIYPTPEHWNPATLVHAITVAGVGITGALILVAVVLAISAIQRNRKQG